MFCCCQQSTASNVDAGCSESATDGSLQPASVVLVTVNVKPERVDDFLEAARLDSSTARDSAIEPGCLRFDCLRSREDANRFVLYEAYLDDAAVDHHRTTDGFKAWRAFKESDGLVDQTVLRLETTSIPGGWAFQGGGAGDGAASSSVGCAVIVSVEVNAGRVEDFLQAMEQDARGSRDASIDPGCVRFDLLRRQDDPQKFIFFECFLDDDAMTKHKETAHYKAWAAFKASGGIKSQDVVRLETASIPGGWAFQG